MDHAVSQVFDCTQKARHVFLKEPDRGIASVAKETANGAASVIVIDVQML
jgi:hypothetical protein